MEQKKIEVNINILDIDIFKGLIDTLVLNYEDLPNDVKDYLDNNLKDK